MLLYTELGIFQFHWNLFNNLLPPKIESRFYFIFFNTLNSFVLLLEENSQSYPLNWLWVFLHLWLSLAFLFCMSVYKYVCVYIYKYKEMKLGCQPGSLSK